MGWPSLDVGNALEYAPCMVFDHQQLSYSASQNILGNGIHLPAFSAWQLYVHAHVLRRDIVDKMPPQLASKPSQICAEASDQETTLI